jgi:glycosyl transferase, family 25
LFESDAKTIVYVINMHHATERMVHVRRQLDRLQIDFTRVAGVDGLKLPTPHPAFSARSYKYLHGRLWSPRELGCYLSHINCLRAFIASDARFALILEDDITLHDDLVPTLRAAINCSDQWNMLRLSTVNHGHWWPVKPLGKRCLSVCLTREKGAGAYLVDRRAASQMLKWLLPMRLAWDIAFDLEWFLGFKTLGIYPMPTSQESDFQTQIQQDIPKVKGPIKVFSVIPFRVVLEVSRLIYRLYRLLGLKLFWRD